ncbi:hypothetical protein Leryth_019380 [Lithospermum erythrorhizon]|uniref:Uncharacterized protein n=1 Tax=Lithospermum erythrorhizon TaxID=34254 RepID=A0AAV3QEI0_LITER|nr:hypothetical protein Leryth_019380 [Lithospermum erythrorhizon]
MEMEDENYYPDVEAFSDKEYEEYVYLHPDYPVFPLLKHVPGSDGWLQWRDEVVADWNKKFPIQQPINLEDEPYMNTHRNLSETIIFCMESDEWTFPEDGSRPVKGKHLAEVFAIDSSNGNLYLITTHRFDNLFVEYAIEGEIIHFFNPDRSNRNRNLNRATDSQIETYNLKTTQWDIIPLKNILETVRLWPHLHRVYSSAIPGIYSKFVKYFRCCSVGNISFCFENTSSQPRLIVRKLEGDVNSLTQTHDEFVRDHQIDLGPYLLKDCCDNHSDFFLNHITGLRFCLHIFFFEKCFRLDTSSVCIFTFELAKVKEGPIRIRDDPDQFKARKGETYMFEIHRILHCNYFKLPSDSFPRTCVKLENGESSRLPM